MTIQPDATDRAVIAHLRRHPRASVARMARQLDLARGTVQARLDRLESRRVITGYGPDIDPPAAGYGVLAFATLTIAQSTHERTIDQLCRIPELIEVHAVTGAGDLFCRIVARSNDHLHEVIQRVVGLPEVSRAETQLVLNTAVSRSVADLIADEVSAAAR